MNAGAFWIRLAVKNLHASRSLCRKSVFPAFGGDPSQNRLVPDSGSHVLGLEGPDE